MHRRGSRGYLKPVVVGVLLYATAGPFPVTHAQVTADGTLGTTVSPVGSVFEITGGTRPGGATLFHSFDSFSVASGQTASFINDGGIPTTSILSRVTGGVQSDIFGTIQTTGFAGAALFLMNPAGIVFGPTAQLDVEGSFHATTADYIKLGSADGIFYADPAQPTVLSVAAPSAFGFLTAKPAPIDVRGELSGVEITGLSVPEGETLSLVGGTLTVGAAEIRDGTGRITQDAMPAYLVAPGGRVNLISVASAGEAAFDGTGFNVDGFAQLGEINIAGGDIRAFGGEFLFASVIDGKEVFIRGGQLVMDNGLISPGASSLFTPSPDGGEVDIRVTGDVSITATDVDFLSNLVPGIFTTAGSFLSPELLPDAKVPDITIEAGGAFTLSGVASVKTDRLGPGVPAHILINADTVTVKDAASIVSLNFFEGPGGDITVNARQIELFGDGTPSPTGVTGISAQNLVHPWFIGCACDDPDPRLTFADAGSITMNAAETLRVSGTALILTDSLGFGRGGDITISAGDIAVIGVGAETAAIKAQSAFAGDAGDITIHASGTIELRDGGQIAGTTVGSGEGSDMTITAGEAITFTGADSRIVNATGPLPLDELNRLFEFTFGKSFETLRDELGLPADADLFDVLGALNDKGTTAIPDLTAGNAGTISISTPVLTLNAGTRIEMSTGWEGNAGALEARVGSLFLSDGARITSRSGIERLTGEVVVGSGKAGAIDITATDTISISGAGSTISTSTLGDGDGGAVSLNANRVQILGGGSVTADSFGAGLTGNITITAGTDIVMSGGTISTLALTSDGGNIKLSAPNIIQLTDSTISTSVESGVGGGGNIDIDPEFIVLNRSQIIANAFGGPGGNIRLTANNFLPSADSTVQASSALSTQGTIVIESPENDIAGSIAQLPQDIVDVSGLLPERCAARRAGGAPSSFVVAGRGGLPTNPDNYLPSFDAGSTPLKSASGPASVTGEAALAHIKDIAPAMATWNCSVGSESPVATATRDLISKLF